MPQASRRYREAEAARDLDKLYPLKDALAQVKSAPKAKFDETVDIAVNLGVDELAGPGGDLGVPVTRHPLADVHGLPPREEL